MCDHDHYRHDPHHGPRDHHYGPHDRHDGPRDRGPDRGPDHYDCGCDCEDSDEPFAFERKFVSQPRTEDRTIEQTLELGWEVLSLLPVEELHRVSEDEIGRYYRG